MTKQHSVSASAGAYEEGSVGVAAAVSIAKSDVVSTLGGTVTAGGNVSVTADAKTLKNDTSSDASVGTGYIGKKVLAVKDRVHVSNVTGSLFTTILNTRGPLFDARAGQTRSLSF